MKDSCKGYSNGCEADLTVLTGRGYFLANFVGELRTLGFATQVAGQILGLLDCVVTGVLDH